MGQNANNNMQDNSMQQLVEQILLQQKGLNEVANTKL